MSRSSDSYLEDELHHLSVDQTMHRLPVDMSDEVTSTKARFLCGTTLLHMLPTGIT